MSDLVKLANDAERNILYWQGTAKEWEIRAKDWEKLAGELKVQNEGLIENRRASLKQYDAEISKLSAARDALAQDVIMLRMTGSAAAYWKGKVEELEEVNATLNRFCDELRKDNSNLRASTRPPSEQVEILRKTNETLHGRIEDLEAALRRTAEPASAPILMSHCSELDLLAELGRRINARLFPDTFKQ